MNTEPKLRAVIELVRGTWLVSFVNRRKHQRHLACQFYAADRTRQWVSDYIRNERPDLVLIEP